MLKTLKMLPLFCFADVGTTGSGDFGSGDFGSVDVAGGETAAAIETSRSTGAGDSAS